MTDDRDPLVAITTSTIAEGGDWKRPQISLYTDYLGALERNGLVGLPVTPAHSRAAIERLLDCVDGLVLSGGEDVDPRHYGEEPIPELGVVNPQRDAMELSALEIALERGLPVLGICRGAQLINVALGGSLYQDLDAQRTTELPYSHRQKEWLGRTHAVKLEPNTRLCALLGVDEIEVNSFHHQGVKALAPGLIPSAITPNGLIEAIELEGDHWVVGVQWHPERHEATAPDTDPDRMLLRAFRAAVARAPAARARRPEAGVR